MTTSPATKSFEDHVRKLVAARYALVVVNTFEEQRLERKLRSVTQKAFSQPVPLFIWTATDGLRSEGSATVAKSEDPLVALQCVLDHPGSALFLFKDLSRFFDNAQVVRKLRDSHPALINTYKTIFISGPSVQLPLELHKDSSVLDLPLPGFTEIAALFTEACEGSPNTSVNLGDEYDAFIRGALGLTESEAVAAFRKLLVGRRTVGSEAIEALYEEKRDIVRKEGILEYLPPRTKLEDIGGLTNLKEWLKQRLRFFTSEADDFGLDPPKGLLLTGISGCGKSLTAKAISAYWRMPLLRLDMNRIYAGISGTPELTLQRAIRTAEAVSPCVLWIDEIETALVGTQGGGAMPQATRIFSSFLTWMQEKEHVVFVAATANEIDKLPPELPRKGRFDEIFFVDLPQEDERKEIFRVHLERRKKDPALLDLVSLAKSTNGFNGAEIEQTVLSSMFYAFDEHRDITMKDLYRAIGKTVPLSTTMSERIKEIKRWADTRAVRAN